MNGKTKGLMPPGLSWIVDNIISKGNILGSSKTEGAKWAKELNYPREAETIFFAGCGYQYISGLEALMSLVRGMDKSAIGMDLPMSIARFQKKLGIDLTGAYRKLRAKGSDSDVQPLKDAAKVLTKLGVEFGYLAEDEPCCGGPLYFLGYKRSL